MKWVTGSGTSAALRLAESGIVPASSGPEREKIPLPAPLFPEQHDFSAWGGRDVY